MNDMLEGEEAKPEKQQNREERVGEVGRYRREGACRWPAACCMIGIARL